MFACNNLLTGTIPDVYSKWVAMQSFNDSHNFLSGTLSDAFSSWTLIKTFESEQQCAIGFVAEWVHGLERCFVFLMSIEPLQQYNSTAVRLMGSNLVATTQLFFDGANNLLTGTLPEALSKWGSAVSRFSVENNSLSGLSPGHLGIDVDKSLRAVLVA